MFPLQTHTEKLVTNYQSPDIHVLSHICKKGKGKFQPTTGQEGLEGV